ncbi:MAG: phospholipid carrier-dependent glycosyltransferase [Clostridiales bacterium]|jgi:Gpi18-like mannosyltransferase/predicted membrane-bound dolichyl-phosphate-mannose-protein mannosyltransferase|nr:phospholipid carrier-dependent glycosyltransferase [Clostridiales bacterium]MDR2749083.1 phospholipid carrier-dependent glycosyltransferase [Clostridiales bacterium]
MRCPRNFAIGGALSSPATQGKKLKEIRDMSTVYAISAGAATLALLAALTDFKPRKLLDHPIALILALGVLARLFLASGQFSYEGDFNTFKAWATMLYQNGLSNFYTSERFTDYPPGYMYALYVCGALRGILGIDGILYDLVLKLPALCCDLALSVLAWKIGSKKLSPGAALALGLAYALNPAVIMDSMLWGQVDSVHTLALALSVMLLVEKKHVLSYPLFALAILIKPQSLTLGPVYLADLIIAIWFEAKEQAEASGEKVRDLRLYAFFKLAALALVSLLGIIALALPFTKGWDLTPIFKQFASTLSSYPYASVNAYNLFTFLGANWKGIGEPFLGLTYNIWGFFFLGLVTAFTIFICVRGRKHTSTMYLAGALLFSLAFLLSIKMHERYLYPALIFACFFCAHKPGRSAGFFYVALSASFYVNCADVINLIEQGNKLEIIKESSRFASLVNIVVILSFAVFAAVKWIKSDDLPDQPEIPNAAEPVFERSAPTLEFRKKELLHLAILIAAYSLIAFINLGDTKAPQTAWAPENKQEFTISLNGGQPATIKKVSYMQGARHDKTFEIWGAGADGSLELLKEMTSDNVFFWTISDVDWNQSQLLIRSTSDDLMVQELSFSGSGNTPIAVEIIEESGVYSEMDPLISSDPAFLFDEQDLVPESRTYMNSTIFDEIYHARTAYEFVHKLKVYEWTHPPLGKAFIALSIKIFGMTPFGWRFAGTFFGILMIPAIYLLARKMFHEHHWALLAAFLFTFDFMHFVQTRISTIDVFVTFFIILMYFFMFMHVSTNMLESRPAFLKSLFWLFLCGSSMGLAVASKWQGAYAMAGLPIIFFHHLLGRWKEYRNRDAFSNTNFNVRLFPQRAAITLFLCLFFFILVPLAIYALSYIPFLRAQGATGISAIIKNQKDMFGYHSKLESTHSFSSRWFEWPVMIRPIYYYSGTLSNGLRSGISSFGNPAVWWTGIAALLCCVRLQSKRYSKTLLFLFIAYASQFLPWALISRTTYIYHYFPSVPFVVMLIIYALKEGICPKWPKAALVLAIASLVLFVAFYPVLSGLPIPMPYVDAALKWFPTWVLS